MVVIRFIFGVGESGAFPIATRSLSRWMLPAERGFAQGITHAGSRLGAAVTPPLVVWMIVLYGWRSPFLAFAGLGLVWSAVWFFYYRDTPEQHRGVNPAELELIQSTTGGPRQQVGVRVPWRRILSSGTVWQLALMYFCYQYALAVYLDWFPTYLNSHRGFDLKQMGFYASLPLLAGTLGDLAGGWFSDLFSAPHRQRHLRPPHRWHRWLHHRSRRNSSSDADPRSQALRRVQLPGLRRIGIDRRRLLGHPARYRRRLCRLHRLRHEYVRQHRRRHFTRAARIPGEGLRLGRSVLRHLRALRRRCAHLLQNRCEPAHLHSGVIPPLVSLTTVAVLAVLFLATFVRSTIGFGEALIAVPLLALVLPVEVAAPLSVLVSITVAVIVVIQDWRNIHFRSAGWLVVSTLFGIPLGLLMLKTVPESIVKAILGLFIILFAIYSLVSRTHRVLPNDRLAPLFGFSAGILGGAYGMNGPPLVIYGVLRRWTPGAISGHVARIFSNR